MADAPSRREFMKFITAGSLAPYAPKSAPALPRAGGQGDSKSDVERWGVYEVRLTGAIRASNPFADVTLKAHFSCGATTIAAEGFYDGEGTWQLRLMPTVEGDWTFVTESNERELDAKRGSFQCVAPRPRNHGPVRVAQKVHFAYAGGTPFFPLGTTLYNWVHRDESLQEETLATLKAAPFNKARFCVFPKWYPFNRVEPPLYPYSRAADGNFDFTRFNPAYFRRFERRVRDLMDMGIQADLILFHPYDKWGFSKMAPEEDDAYLRYVVSRLAAYRNVWWTMANEWDFIEPPKDWDHIFRTVEALDPYAHPRGIHNGYRWYNHAEPWVTHCVIQQQTDDCYSVALGARLRYGKPVVVDEYGYEGNNGDRWGNLSGRREVLRHWDFTMAGAYGSHGETYVHPGDILWWAVGGTLVGESLARLAFLKRIFEEAPFQSLEPAPELVKGGMALAKENDFYFFYFPEANLKENAEVQLEGPGPFALDLIDPWLMKVYPLGSVLSGRHSFRPKSTPSLLRLRRNSQAESTTAARTIDEALWDPHGAWESGPLGS